MPYRVGPYLIDPEAYELRAHGIPTPVEPQVLDLIVLLIENRTRIVSKDEILRSIWKDRIVSDAALSTRVKTARRSLGDTGKSQALIRTVYGRGFRFVGEVSDEPDRMPGAENIRTQAVPPKSSNAMPTDRPSLAVLPFEVKGHRRRSQSEGEGLADAITAGLSRIKSFFVIANASSRRFADPNADVRKIARTLGVRYVIHGSVMSGQDPVHVEVQLIDGPSRQITWSQTFAGSPGKSAGLHEKITESIVGALAPNVLLSEIERVRRKPPEAPEAYDYVLRAMAKCWLFEKAGCTEAMALLQRALDLAPDYGLALALLSWCHGQQWVYNWSDDPQQKQQALRFAQRAVSVDGRDPLVLILLGTAECLVHKVGAAALHVSQGLALDPNSAWGWNRNGYIHNYCGQAEAAIGHFQRSLRLSPFDPMTHSTCYGLAGANFVAGRYDEALVWLDRAMLSGPEMIWMHRLGAACAAMAGDRERAALSVERILGFAPGIDAGQLTAAVPWQVPEIRERYRTALVRAGFAAQA